VARLEKSVTFRRPSRINFSFERNRRQKKKRKRKRKKEKIHSCKSPDKKEIFVAIFRSREITDIRK